MRKQVNPIATSITENPITTTTATTITIPKYEITAIKQNNDITSVTNCLKLKRDIGMAVFKTIIVGIVSTCGTSLCLSYVLITISGNEFVNGLLDKNEK